MKSLPSLMLTIGLAASPVAAAAQEPIAPPGPRGPIARAITADAIRLGAAVGAWLGFGVAIVQATTPCGESCRDEKARAWAGIIGLPVAGGFLGYHAFARNTAEVIYRSR